MFGKDKAKEVAKKEMAVVNNESNSMLATIQQAALDPDVDVDKMKALLDMQERIMDKNSEAAFNVAMVKCQEEIPMVPKDGKGENNHYAKLETMQQMAMAIISANGFCLSYGTDNAPSEMEMRITCKVSHSEGHSRDYFIDFPRDDTGQKGAATKTKIHGAASALTYGQRYLMKMIFNLQVGGMDNDGNSEVEFITEEQVANIEALITEVKADKSKFLNYIKASSVKQIPADYYNNAIAALEKKRS